MTPLLKTSRGAWHDSLAGAIATAGQSPETHSLVLAGADEAVLRVHRNHAPDTIGVTCHTKVRQA